MRFNLDKTTLPELSEWGRIQERSFQPHRARSLFCRSGAAVKKCVSLLSDRPPLHFRLDHSTPSSLLSLACSVLIPLPVVSPQCEPLSYKGAQDLQTFLGHWSGKSFLYQLLSSNWLIIPSSEWLFSGLSIATPLHRSFLPHKYSCRPCGCVCVHNCLCFEVCSNTLSPSVWFCYLMALFLYLFHNLERLKNYAFAAISLEPMVLISYLISEILHLFTH